MYYNEIQLLPFIYDPSLINEFDINENKYWFMGAIDLSINDGELRCLIGPNGAGKTTVLDIICGKTKCSSGNVFFNNQPFLFIELKKIISNKSSILNDIFLLKNIYLIFQY